MFAVTHGITTPRSMAIGHNGKVASCWWLSGAYSLSDILEITGRPSVSGDETVTDARSESNHSSGGAAWQIVVRPVIESIMRVEQVPGMVIAVARCDEPPTFLAIGTDGAGETLHPETRFPVASLTKLATALAVLRLVDAGRLALDDPLASHLPEAAAAHDGVTIRALLSHVAGLPMDIASDAAPYTPALDWPTLARACLVTAPIEPPHTFVRYSNVGIGLLAIVVERLTGMGFSAALESLVFAPLEIEGYLGVEPPQPPARITGALGAHEGDDFELFNSPFWRALAMPWGGMVTTADGALALARAFAGLPAGYLSPDLLAEAIRNQTNGLAGDLAGLAQWPQCPWGLGVELRGTKEPHFAPSQAAPTSFGHAGSSGCLAWVDPIAGVAWAILGTRTIDPWGLRRMPAIGAAILSAPRT